MAIALEETGLAYEHRLVDIRKGDKDDPANLAGASTGKLPVIRDLAPAACGNPKTVCESSVILTYIADKKGQPLPAHKRRRQRRQAQQWLYRQGANLGPTSGQALRFPAFALLLAPDFANTCAHNRCFRIMADHWRVLDRRLGDNRYIAGEEYSIADINYYPWIIYFDPAEAIDALPNIRQWRNLGAIKLVVRRAYRRADELKTGHLIHDKNMSVFPLEDIRRNMIVICSIMQ